ncbi:MAG: WD40/YVTN/BNR-like repeat-containing protein, partial [Actinomycetota bacterium]
MTDLERAGSELVRAVPDDPAPMDQLRQRVSQRRRRRIAAVTVAALILGLGIGAVPLVGLLAHNGSTQLQVGGGQSTTPSAVPSPTLLASPPAGAPNAGALPGVADLSITDSSWSSDQVGWLLGTASCRGGPCAVAFTTSDGGATWTRVPAPPGDASHLRSATAQVGYAYGVSALYMTTDGGQTWQKQAAPAQIEDLEIGDGTAYLLGDRGPGCPGPCDVTLEASDVGTASWHQL